MISPGHHLYVGPDGTWRYAAPGDRFVRVGGPDHELREAQRILHCERDESTADGRLWQVLAGFRARGLVAAEPEPDPSRGTATIHIEGDNAVAELVAELLRPYGNLTTGPVDEGVVTRSDLLISCAGWLPDTSWREIDAWCFASGTPWHRLHFEGTAAVLGPLYVPGRTASYEDTRGRRLAASGVAEELLAHWAYLDGPDPKPPVPCMEPGGASVLAGLLVGDVLACVQGEPVPTGVCQLVVELATAQVSRHPVLPLPAVAA